MLTKELLKKEFSREWERHYQIQLFRERGFVRRRCSCGKNFWTLDAERKTCGDSSCEGYGFVGRPITKGRWDYTETWRLFEKFFKKNGHASIKRYPVIDRWRPDLFFTIASIQDFQRIEKGRLVMENPADPLIVPQVCLRFPDIPNVGVTGRHHTCFMMPGQHSFGAYWKDRCIELNFRFLTKSMGIPETELTYVEDLWAMPDFSQFGPSLETMSRGLELVNSVFSQFTRQGEGYTELPQKIIDVGWGHERLVWFSHGTPTGYDAVFGPVIEWMKKKTGFRTSELFEKYSLIAGGLNYDEVANIKKAKEEIAKKLGVSMKHLTDVIEPMQALYAIADHTKALLFAVTDGGIPSNIGGGYNLRVILRRALSFINEYNLGFELIDVSERHVRHLREMFPELEEGLRPLTKILDIEKTKYEETMGRAHLLIQKELDSKRRLDRQYLTQLYVSNGITPELVEKVAKKKGIDFTTPEDFYLSITSGHMKEEKKEMFNFDVSGLPSTEPLYYEDPYRKEFDARILRAFDDKNCCWVVLDKTLFYAEGGGQPGDRGILRISGKDMIISDTQRIGDIILHKASGSMKEGRAVHGIIDWENRYKLMRMHTTTHIVAGAARRIIGPHVWQAGAKKGTERSRIDLTHYLPFTEKEIEQIEAVANSAVKEKTRVTVEVLPRNVAEQRYGFVLYQGGASPGKTVRVIKLGEGFDVEACGGTHVKSAGEIELIKITRNDRIQDGVNRLEFTCGEEARRFMEEQKRIMHDTLDIISGLDMFRGSAGAARSVIEKEPGRAGTEVRRAAKVFSVEPQQLASTVKRFADEISSIRKSGRTKKLKSLEEICEMIFTVWKQQKKAADRLMKKTAAEQASGLIAKARGGMVFDVVGLSRRELIETAGEVLTKRPDLTVILANQRGDVVGMSKKQDAGKLVREICTGSGGSGGGSQGLGQGRAELSKLLKVMKNYW